MSVEVNLQGMPSHILDGVQKQETIQIDRSFSKFKVGPWDPTPLGEAVNLHLSYYRNPRLLLSEKALRLTYRHARQNNNPQFTCFLLGTFIVDRDEECVTLTLDRLDPGREKPDSGRKVPNSFLPGDVVVPCLFEVQQVGLLTNNVPAHYADDLSGSLKILQQSCTSKKAMELSQLLMLRGWLSCIENTDSLNFNLYWAGFTLATMLKATPIKGIPIIPTALARNLSSPINLAQPLNTVSQKRGFLSMDQTCKLLLVLESDPKVYTLPLVGVWLCGVTHIHSPQVWAWCLRYLYSASIQERVLSEGRAFLVVLYSLTHREPEFYQCQPTSRENHNMDLLLLTSTESLTLYKNLEPKERKPLSFELSSGSENQATEFYKEVMSRAASSRHVTGDKVATSPQNRISINDHDSGVEDEDLSPRPSPNPHPAGDQMRQVQPTVPELSLVMDVSFVAGITKSPDATPQHLPLPTLQQREICAFPKTHKELYVSGQNKLNACPPMNRTVTQTMSKEGCEGSTGFSHRSSLPLLSSPPKMATLPDGSSELGYAQESKPYTPDQSIHSQSPHCRFSGTTPAQPLPQLCMFPSTSLKCVNKPCSCCHHHYTALSYQSQHWPETPLPSDLLNQMTPTNPATVSCIPKSTPHRGCCLSPPHRTSHQGPVYVSKTSPHLDCLQHSSHSKRRQSHPVPSVSQGCQSQDACMDVYDACFNMLSVDAYRILMDQDRQLKLLQSQIHKLLEAQSQGTSSHHSDSSHQSGEKPAGLTLGQKPMTPDPKKRNSVSIAIGTGASLFCGKSEDEWWRGGTPGTLSSGSAHSRQSSPTAISQTHTNRIKDPEDETRSSDQNHKESQQIRSPGVSHSFQSLMLGESASTCYQFQSANTEESHGKSVAADQRFFQDLLGQVNDRLQDTLKGEARSSRSEYRTVLAAETALSPVLVQAREASSPNCRSPVPSLKALSQSESSHKGDQVYNATVKHLEKLGVNVDSKGKGMSTNATVESASTLASINPEAVIPRLAVCDFVGASMLIPGCSADLSLEANSIALKYLSDAQLSHLSFKREAKQTSNAIPPRVDFLSKTERTAAGLSILSPTNMSLATQKYMKRYGLIEGGDSEEEDLQEQQNGMHHDTVLDCSAQMDSSRNSDDFQKGINVPSSPPGPHSSPHLENEGLVFGDKHMLLHSHNHTEKTGTREITQKRHSASENQSPLGTMDTQGSVGNFLDLSRLRQLPKLF
ncbi:SCL-interrupting locus protein homolog isoform X2 [Alosa sapidissima]|uniref:SCL-interrupting locus protein homolog isoform X2 n=1 Tax=Alosa sapidissima TaxID=34773 RepID=UPI001C08CA9B|nr:SCL-interrupting locus protein homolog isoform X2 [Alosa sapidissima]